MKKQYAITFSKTIFATFCGIVLSCCVLAQTQYGWIEKANFAGPARHRASSAAVGNRGYMGLGHINSVFDVLFDDWFEYDPGTDSWTQKANYPGGPRMHPATFVVGNKVYVGTGRDISGGLHQDFWCFDPVTNTWVSIAPFPGSGRRGAIAFTLNGFGYVGTGSSNTNFFKYDPTTNSWSAVTSLPSMGRISAVGFAINGKGYLTTGDGGGPTNDIWEYDPILNSWTQKANLPGLPRMEACGFALNGKGYVGTGDNFSSGTNYQDFWCYNPLTNSWIQIPDFVGQARRYMSSFVIGNRAYVGLGTSGINYADLWEFGSISDVEENEVVSASMEIFPNPIIETATVTFSREINNGKLILSDMNGKEIQIIPDINGKSFSLQRNNLAGGIYFLTLVEEKKSVSTSKIIFD